MSVLEIIITITILLCCLASFVYSIVKIFKKNTSKFFIFICLATGCYFIEELCAFVYKLCGNNALYDGFQVSNLGFFSVMLFMLTAYFGVFDKNVERNSDSKKASLIALIAPCIALAVFIVSLIQIINTSSYDLLGAMIFLFILMFPVSYFALKFLLLSNKNEKCKIAFYINLDILLFILTNLIYFILYLNINAIIGYIIIIIACGIEMALLPILCVKESKKWEI